MARPVPHLFLRILQRRLPPRLFDEVAGDIEERWRRESRDTPLRAWMHLLALTVSLLWHVGRDRRRHQASSTSPAGGSMLAGTLQDLRFALRFAARQPWLSAAAAGTLAIGVAASTAMFSVMHAWLLTPLPYREPERLVMVWETIPSASVLENSPAPASLTAWQARARAFARLAPFTSGSVNLTGAGDPLRLSAAVVSRDLLDVLGVAPRLGRNFTAEESQPNGPSAAVLTHEIWRDRFGGRTDIVGEQIVLSGVATTVVGVLPSRLELARFPADVWLPMRMTAADRESESRMLWVVGRLAPGASVAQAATEVDAIMRDRSEGTLGADVVPLQAHTLGSLSRDVPLLFAAAAFVLLVACGNVASLTLARTAGRHEELVVRRALGASRTRIVRQMVTESIALGVAAGGAGLLLASWAIRTIVVLAPQAERMPAVPAGSPPVIAFAFLISTLTVAVFSVLPAWHSVRTAEGDVMRAGARRLVGGRQRLLRTIVAGEVALALALVVGAWHAALSYEKLTAVELGFDPRGVMTFELWRPADAPRSASIAFFETLLDHLDTAPGITAAGLTQAMPIRSASFGSGFVVEHREPDAESILAYWRAVSPGFFEALSIPVLAGRTFDARDRDGNERTAIVSASFAARAWPNGEAVGRRIGWATFDEPITVIGIADDVRVTPAASPTPHVYLPYRQVDGWLPQGLAVRSDLGPTATIDAVRRIVAAIDPLQPVSGIARLEQLHEDAMGRRRFQLALFSTAAGIAVLLALGGIYGVLSYAGRQMSPELGLRLALGASRAGLLWHVMRVGLTPALLGILLGTMLAWWSATPLRGILYEADPRDPGTLAAAAALLTAASMAACLVPAWRAARTDPLITMRAQ